MMTTANPSTTSLAFRALDAHVLAGRADEPALSTETITLSFAQLLHESAVIAGAFAQVGVMPGHAMALDGLDRHHEVVAVLALVRLGGLVGTDSDVRLTGRPPTLAVGEQDPVAWQVLTHAGRIDPLPARASDPDDYEQEMLEAFGDVLTPLLAGETVRDSGVA